MLEMARFRDSPAAIFADLEWRGLDRAAAETVIAADERWRSLIDEGNKLRSDRNRISREIGTAKKAGGDTQPLLEQMQTLKQRLPQLEQETAAALAERDTARMRVPNLLDEAVPQGDGPDGNVELAQHGERGDFGFEPKSHNELLETLAGADLERAAKVAGRRFYFLTGGLARLELALVNYAVELLAERGYEPVVPPFVMNREAYEGVVDLGDFEEVMYKIEDHDLYLIATSEHPLTARFRDEILEPKSLPLKFCGLSTNFRREVGAHGLSDRGIWRVHQFAKVEQVAICKPEDSAALHEELLQNAVDLLAGLEVPFRVIDICTGDIGTVAARKFDLEAWMPSVGEWKEVVSASNCTAYQSLRLNMRYRTPDGTATPHTLNATGIATTRTLAAILENCQRADGSVAIPEPLRKWMGDAEALTPA
ncbi:MAG: serine--tRNA ligase [Candidatus Poseidoniia archaeon]|jgi:seryl-tRNA synthetase|nr:serine--tRNA ligase [Candidatus Poseidoniia archaeon]MDP6658772.1 serine--tRNA ligase [Candidatus Poseidoniia archaeon]MDP6846602.1 serine--tRNA ligase [Candidatus Poseidoniia archaeon]